MTPTAEEIAPTSQRQSKQQTPRNPRRHRDGRPRPDEELSKEAKADASLSLLER